jgi:Response regulator of the LytR/AlgR family
VAVKPGGYKMIIGICDDEPLIVRALTRLVGQSLEKLKIEAEITTFLSGDSMIKRVEDLDAAFLDIDMPEMDGIEVGKAIIKRNPNCKIIMATGKVERFKDTFKINAFRFVTKPFDIDEIEEALEALIKLKIGEEVIPLFLNRLQYNIPQKKIKYFKAFNGYSEAMVEEICFRKELSLNEIEELLDNRLFARINKQYIVNMQFVEYYKNSKIKIGENVFPVSRRKQKDFEKKYINFDINYRG